MKKRIYGLETEYGIALIDEYGRWYCDSTTLTPYLDFLRNSYVLEFLPNGARIYVDRSYHPEYSTAECADLVDLIAQDKAGEKILDEISIKAAQRYGIKRIALFKQNVQYAPERDEQGHNTPYYESPVTFGCHENFSMDPMIDERLLSATLTPFLVARQVIAGSGWVANPPYQRKKLRYVISQRARFIKIHVGADTTSLQSRAIICLARWGEPHADEKKYRRLHLILGDSNMSEISTYLKMGTLGILLEMIEEGYPLDVRAQRFMPRDPVLALHSVSFDLTCKKPVIELLDRESVSAIDVLWGYVAMMEEYKKMQGLSDQLSDVLRRLEDTLKRLEKREIDKETLMEVDSQGLDQELDWLITKSLHEHTLRRFGWHWHNFFGKEIAIDTGSGKIGLYDKLIANDLAYHDISQSGLYNQYFAEPDLPLPKLRELQIRTSRIVEKAAIENMEKNPPQNTRAKIRGDFIKFLSSNVPASDLPGGWQIHWSRIVSSPKYGSFPPIKLDDPFATEDERIEWLKSIIRSASS